MTFRPPKAGELKHLASVQTFDQTGKDENGQPVGEWTEVCTTWVKREALTGRNIEYGRQMYASATHNVYLRYLAVVTRNTRFVIGDAVYAVGFVDTVGIQWLRCTCEESWPKGDPT